MNIEHADFLDPMFRALEEFRKINQNVTANLISVFLLIALRPGVTQKQLEKLTGLNNATVSRICAVLSDRGLAARGQKGMGLIRIELSQEDYRSRTQHLTPQGRRVLESIKHIFDRKRR